MTSARITTVTGTAIALDDNDIDTDRVIPARFVKSLTFDTLGAHAFADDRAMSEHQHPFDDPRRTHASILVVAKNFGCGSSREHAPQALIRRGVRAIVGESFGEIFRGNSGAIGLPCVTLDGPAARELRALVTGDPALAVTVDLTRREVRAEPRTWPLDIPESTRERFVDGRWDTLAELLSSAPETRKVMAGLPYLTGFPAAG
jgi:3-isopropylmalate/(R)-2-methylmalate dehydratase small subunit